MTALYLDIDGVLNDHKPTPSGFCTIDADKVVHLNRILDACPEVQIVISSAWRYLILTGQMKLSGFENMLLTYGIKCRQRIYGITPQDEDCRGLLISKHAEREGIEHFVVLDDLALPIPQLVQTDGNVGLTSDIADCVIRRLQEEKK